MCCEIHNSLIPLSKVFGKHDVQMVDPNLLQASFGDLCNLRRRANLMQFWMPCKKLINSLDVKQIFVSVNIMNCDTAGYGDFLEMARN